MIITAADMGWVFSIGQFSFGFSPGSTLTDDRVEISVSCSFEGASEVDGNAIIGPCCDSSRRVVESHTKVPIADLMVGLWRGVVFTGPTRSRSPVWSR